MEMKQEMEQCFAVLFINNIDFDQYHAELSKPTQIENMYFLGTVPKF